MNDYHSNNEPVSFNGGLIFELNLKINTYTIVNLSSFMPDLREKTM